MNQNLTPLWESIKRYVNDGIIPYHMPGHKQGKGISRDFFKFLGPNVFKIDLTEVDGLDNLHCPLGVIAEAQKLAADAFGVTSTYFLVNGASAGVEALLMSFAPEEEIIIPRNAHCSVMNGLILSGGSPLYIWPEYNNELGLPLPAGHQQIIDMIKGHKKAKGLFLTNPTYHGISNNLQKVIPQAKKSGLYTMVDEAHGPHFYFHKDLPENAMEVGADASVHGAHKLIGALTQAAYLHLSGQGWREGRIKSALRLFQTTSPSYILMASLDLARMQMATIGKDLLEKTINISRKLRYEINKIRGLYCFGEEELLSLGDYFLDVTKITLNVSGLGLSGFQVQQILRNKYKIQAEMADTQNVLFFITIGDKNSNAKRLLSALKEISQMYFSKGRFQKNNFIYQLPRPKVSITPRVAWLSDSKEITIENALGEIAAEPIIPYPPGIPLIYPGEIIDQNVIELVTRYKRDGYSFQGTEDVTLTKIKIVI